MTKEGEQCDLLLRADNVRQGNSSFPPKFTKRLIFRKI